MAYIQTYVGGAPIITLEYHFAVTAITVIAVKPTMTKSIIERRKIRLDSLILPCALLSEIIFDKAIIAAVPRNSSDSETLKSHYQNFLKPLGARACILEEPVLSVSSTFIRENIENYDLIKSLIDRNVYEYIVKNNLYRE